jgi:hypothetical protein
MNDSEINFLIQRGFRIIRKDLVKGHILVKKPRKSGWAIDAKFSDPVELERRFEAMMQNEKTVQYP